MKKILFLLFIFLLFISCDENSLYQNYIGNNSAVFLYKGEKDFTVYLIRWLGHGKVTYDKQYSIMVNVYKSNSKFEYDGEYLLTRDNYTYFYDMHNFTKSEYVDTNQNTYDKKIWFTLYKSGNNDEDYQIYDFSKENYLYHGDKNNGYKYIWAKTLFFEIEKNNLPFITEEVKKITHKYNTPSPF